MSSAPPPLPPFSAGLLVGGSPAQLAMRAQAVLPPFPSLSPTQSASSPLPSLCPSPPLSAASSDLANVTHVHLSCAYSHSPPAAAARREQAASSLSLTGPPLPPPAAAASPAHGAHGSGVAAIEERYASLSATTAAELAGSKAHKAAICALLEALQTTMFTKKKEALDAYQSFVSAHHPRFGRSDALLLLYGSPVTPNSTLSSFHSTASFTRMDRGLLAASGQLSWKNHQLRASAAKALGIVAALLDGRHNADAAVFHQLIAECDYSTIRLMKLPKHLSAPSPASSAQGNLHAALRVIDIVKDIRPDLIDSLLEEKDAAAAHSSHSHSHTHSLNRPPAAGGPRSPPPTLQLSAQHNATAASSPRASQLHDAAPPSPRTPNSPPPLPSSLLDHAAAMHSSQPYRPPPPLPPQTAAQQLQQLQPCLPTVPTCQSPQHSASAWQPSWLSTHEPSGSSGHSGGPTSITVAGSTVVTQPMSACSSPLASRKKQFSSLPAGLQRLTSPLAPAVPVTVAGGAGHGGGSVSGSLSDDWKQRLRGHLSGFFAHRVSREELERAGVLKRSQLFGVPLEQLSQADDADRDAHIPRVLRRCVDVLSAPDVLSLPGLFRISGDSREINEMKVRLDVGELVDLSAASPHSVAGLLKMWLRELPEPLLTFDMYAPVIATVRAMQQQQQQQSDVTDALLALIDHIPAAHRHTLDALLAFLRLVSGSSAVNLMTASNLAICFSPNILRPRIETLESVAKDTPIAIAAITALIRQPQQQHHTEALDSHTMHYQPVSPTTPTPKAPTVAVAMAADGRPTMPSVPPPIPPSPRSLSLGAAGASLHSASGTRSPPPIPAGALLSRTPLHPPNFSITQPHLAPPTALSAAAGKMQEEYKCDEGQAAIEPLMDVYL